TMALIAEMLQLAASGGLAVERLPECLAGGYADSTVLQNFALPMAAGAVKSANLVTTLLKDLGNACAFGETTATAMPMTALATQLYRTLYVNRHGGHDGLGILRLYRESPLTR
ncbi:MAG: NAD-binding protein, partial [Alphaproteobacteria bacterium]